MAKNLKLRTLEIDIWDSEWAIIDLSIQKSAKMDIWGVDEWFGVARLYKGKISYLHDLGIYLEEKAGKSKLDGYHLRAVRKFPLLQEECIFTYPKEGVEFRGTFLDAFKFIKPRLDE